MPLRRRRRRSALRSRTPRLYRRRRIRSRALKFKVSEHVSREIGGIFLIGFALLNFLALYNNAGSFGVFWKTTILEPVFGLGASLLPAATLVIGLSLLLSKKITFASSRVLGLTILTISTLGLIQLSAPVSGLLESARDFGGYIGFMTTFMLFMIFGSTGTTIILSLLAMTSLLLILNVSFGEIIRFLSDRPSNATVSDAFLKKKMKLEEILPKHSPDEFELNIVRGDIEARPASLSGRTSMSSVESQAGGPHGQSQKMENRKPRPLDKTTKEEASLETSSPKIDYSNYQFPDLDFLHTDEKNKVFNDDQLVQNAEIIRRKLEQFSVQVTMKDAHVGPTVVQYTLKPAEDIKLSKITTLKNDLALALSARAIRIEAPIPGKGLVGIEIPVHERSIVHLGSIMRSPVFEQEKGELKLPLGRDVSGHPMVSELTKMPHLLLSGQTGSGKSIGINSFLISLLYQHTPETLRLILIDPKRVELTNYNGIPHLLTPVIIEWEKALHSLKWTVSEMNRRYKTFANHGKRNISEYNRAFPEACLPYIVIVIDELADLMMAASREIEATICRIAQMARATGIHLIIATQRPSVDVITGLIKANIPTRIAYTVATGIDSRTIIDGIGAEDLIGEGDMLYLASNMAKPLRLQGAFVSTKEIEKVIHFIKLNSPTGVQYDDSITDEHTDVMIPGLPAKKTLGTGALENTTENDLEIAIQTIREGRKASASYLQRRCSFGYAKAARILDQLEEMGLVGPANGAKPRAIFISDEVESDDGSVNEKVVQS